MTSLTLSSKEASELTGVSKVALRKMMVAGTLKGHWNPRCYRLSLYSLLVKVMGCPEADAMRLVAEQVEMLGSSALPSRRGSNAQPHAEPQSRRQLREASSQRTSGDRRTATEARRLRGRPASTSRDEPPPETNPGVVAALKMFDEFERRCLPGVHHG